MSRRSLIASSAAVLLAAGLPLQIAALAQSAPNGEALFRQRCQTCHQIVAGKASTVGPNLYGVVNRKAAAAPLPFKYSEALTKSGLTWTRANLDKYLTAPAKMVPGTKMVIGLTDVKQRSAVIDYLARNK